MNAPQTDVAALLREGVASLSKTDTKSRGDTSDLSVDEILLLHAADWEPVGLLYGASIFSIPQGTWWGSSAGSDPRHIGIGSSAATSAFSQALARLRSSCAQVGGAGVVGVEVEFDMGTHHAIVQLKGSAIRRVTGYGQGSGTAGSSGRPNVPLPASKQTSGSGSIRTPFTSDLSARDFTLLERAGWAPVELSFGASFVYAPRRSMSTAINQAGQNVELQSFTSALYGAREHAIGQMQDMAHQSGAAGIIGVNVSEGPMHFASQVVGFTCRGTAVRLTSESHQKLNPRMVMTLDDYDVTFDAASLRG